MSENAALKYASEIETQRQRTRAAHAADLAIVVAQERAKSTLIEHDPDSLQLLRIYIREAYTKGMRLPQRDATVRSTLDELDRIAVDLGTEIEAPQPRLPLGRP